MAQAQRRDNESFDSLLNRFKQDCARSGIISDIKKHQFFYPPSVMRRKRIASAKKRHRKTK
ncbi:MAG: 30S ribosomal protein S21 [Caldisericia bacterium]|nr:30S ribosomal protein S21 [Caldisericia bacterium]